MRGHGHAADLAAAFHAHWERHFAISRGGSIVAAVSGGIDSMVLLALLAREQAAGAGVRIVVAHFDHRTRGRQSAEDGRFVAAAARQWGMEVVLGRGDAPARAAATGAGPAAAARELRLAFLTETARGEGAGAVVTGHQRDDRVETVLLRLLRGTSPDGLAALAPIAVRSGVTIFRPLLPFTRAAIEQWAGATGVPFREDPSNRAPASPRARLRHGVMPHLARLNSRFGEAVVRLSALAARDAAWLRGQARALLEAATLERGDRAWKLEAGPLASAPAPLLSRALIEAWTWGAPAGTPPPGAEWIEGAMEFVEGGRGGRVACPGGGWLRRAGAVIEFHAAARSPAREEKGEGARDGDA